MASPGLRRARTSSTDTGCRRASSLVLGEAAGEFGVDRVDLLPGRGDLVAQALFEGGIAFLGGLAEGADEGGFGPGAAGFGILAVANELGQFAVALGEAGGHLGHGIGSAGGLHQLGDLEAFVGDAGGGFVGGVCCQEPVK